MERRCKKRKPAASEEPSLACVVHDVPDDLLRLILLRLDSPLWLMRAACACKRWQRIVDGGDGGRAFLRLAKSLHPPVVLGHYHISNDCHRSNDDDDEDGGHRFVPCSSPAPPVRPFLDFCPSEFLQRHHHTIVGHWRNWHIADCHGGLVLLREGFDLVSCLVVCDTLSRRCRYIYHPPELASLTRGARFNYKDEPCVFLLDGGNDDSNISISNFRVLYYCFTLDNVTDVYVFSSSADGGEWRFVRQSTAASDHGDHFSSHIGGDIGRIDGSLYMASHGIVRMLDKASLELSKVDLPMRVMTKKSGLPYSISTFAVVHGASAEPTASPATAYIIHVFGEYLELFRRIPSSGEWVLEHSIPRLSEATRGLQGYPEGSRWLAVGVIEGGTRSAVMKVYLPPTSESESESESDWLFSLDVDTMQLQVVPHDVDMNRIIYTLPWPQFLKALPS